MYDTLERDAQTADFIARIEELKAATDPGPALEVPAECTGSSPLALPDEGGSATESEASEPDAVRVEGVYRWTVTEEDARAYGDARLISDELLPWYPMMATLTLADGAWELLWRGGDGSEATDGPGTYTVDGDHLLLDFPQDVDLTFTFSIDEHANLDVEPVLPMHEDAQFLFSHYQWERLAGDDGAGDEAASPEGT